MLKALATEEYEKRETNLFGLGFLEKASKRLEAEKTLAVKTFAKYEKNIHVRLWMDNKTTIFYINHMGGT